MHESFRLQARTSNCWSIFKSADVQLSVHRLHALLFAMIVSLDRITRRAFVTRSATFFSALVLPSRERWALRAPIAVRIGVASPATMPHDHRFGLDLGLDEARHAATLFGGSIIEVPIASSERIDGALSAIIGAEDEESSIVWTRGARQARTIYMNVGCPSDRLRKEACSRSAFHIAPSDAMARDALTAAKSASNTRAQSWDAALTRFGADTLNQRFLMRFHTPMTPGAWSAWFAVKATWESALRQKSGDAQQIAAFLGRETTQFDGHKGTPLSFRSWDHQLRQPLYVVGDGPPKQIPDGTGDESVRDALDRLGTSTRTSSCEAIHE
jgi:hypothetical protein